MGSDPAGLTPDVKDLRMPLTTSPTPDLVYRLADHLDAVLAAGEDLSALAYTAPAPKGPVSGIEAAVAATALAKFVGQVASLEAALVARMTEARKQARALAKADVRFKPIVGLLEGGTAELVDAVAALGDRTNAGFTEGGDAVQWLRSRALIVADAPGLAPAQVVRVGDGTLIASKIMLGPLLDLAATFLDALELHFELFADAADTRTREVAVVLDGPVAQPGE